MRKLLLLSLGILFLNLVGSNSLWAQTDLPYSVNFGESQDGWTSVDNSSTPGTSWKYEARWAYSQGNYYPCVAIKMDYSATCNDYYISPAFQLEANVEYTLKSIHCTSSPGNGANMSLEIGTSATDMTTFKSISECTVPDYFTNTEEQTYTFTVETAGTYYLAYHATSPQFNSDICLFSFSLSDGEGGGTDPEDPVGTVPYDINMLDNMTNRGWYAHDNNQDGVTWTATTGFGVSLQMALSNSHNDDYISPKFPLKAGKSYKITTSVAVNGAAKPGDNIKLIQGNNPLDMTSLKQLNLSQPGENVEETYITIETDGDYYFGFRNMSTTGGNTLILYRFALEEVEDVPGIGDVVFSSDFESVNPLEGWSIFDANQDMVTWEKTDGVEGITYHGSMAAGAADDWLVTPAFTVSGGMDYLIKYTFSQSGAFDADKVEIRWGEKAETASLSNLIATETIDLGNGEYEKICRISAQTGRDIYLAVRIVTPDMNGNLSLKSIEVITSEKAVPNPIENLDVVSDFNEKTVKLSWNNPTFDTDGAPIQGNLEANIYENNNLIKTLTEVVPGTSSEYSYTPSIEFTGNVAYKVTAVLQGHESKSVEKTICLDDLQGDSILAYELSLKDQEAFDQWLIEDKNGGKTWTYNAWGEQVVIPYMSPNNNDWLFSPEVELTSDKRYIVKYEFKSSSFGSDLDLTVGKERTSTAHTRVIASHKNALHDGFETFATGQFSVEENGTYSIGFHAGAVGNSMIIRNIAIYYIGEKEEEIPVMTLPYSQNFGDEVVDEGWMPEGWSTEGNSGMFGFQVSYTYDWFGIKAYSEPNALCATGGVTSPREEWVYTPKFNFEKDETYVVEFQLLMPEQNGRNNTLSVYQATDHASSAILQNELLKIENTSVAEWTKQSFEFTAADNQELCFAVKVACGLSNAGYIMIDDFTVKKAEKEVVAPESPDDASTSFSGLSKSVFLFWSNPVLDVQGGNLSASTQIISKIYEGETLLGEVTGAPGEKKTYEYKYSEQDFTGQKIYKIVSYIADVKGKSATCVVTLSSFTDGYLKEHTYIANFTNSDEWAVEDADKDGKQWNIEEGIALTEGNDEWLISPSIMLETDKSYYVLCELQTNSEGGAGVSFAYGNEQSADAMTETIQSYDKLELSDYAELYIGGLFTPQQEENFFGIHVTNNTGDVRIKSLKVMRMFTRNEPEELPYTENFENQMDIDKSTNFINKWGRRTSSAELFRIAKMPEDAPEAPSGEYAAIANEFEYNKRTETLYTPYFTLENGKTYEVSYYLYMPGNEGRNTNAAVLLALTQDDMGIELPVLQSVTEPVKDWTKFSFKFKNSNDTYDYCFYFYFEAAEAKSGMIAIDDFSIKEVEVGLEETQAGAMYYSQTDETLYLPENIEHVDVYTVQGVLTEQYSVNGNTLKLDLNQGVYIVRGYAKDGQIITLKIVK